MWNRDVGVFRQLHISSLYYRHFILTYIEDFSIILSGLENMGRAGGGRQNLIYDIFAGSENLVVCDYGLLNMHF